MSEKTLASSEEVIASIQDHWVIVLKYLFIVIIGWTIAILLGYIGWFLRSIDTNFAYVILLISFILILLTHHIFCVLLYQWEISSLILTNKQLIIIRFIAFVEDDFEFIELEEIHSIEKRKHGLIKNLLNYGEVFISMSGRGEILKLRYIRRPTKFVNFLEAVKFGKPLDKTDAQGIGAAFSEKYEYFSK